MTDHSKPGSRGEHELQRLFGTADRARGFYNKQMLDHLSPAMCEYIARQDLMFIATADAHGECDCSLRSGEPGFVRVLDDRTVMYPELRGNGVLASLGNISENPHVALAFFDFCASTVGLHVNGRARIVDEPPAPSPSEDEDKRAYKKRIERWVVVDVIEAYIHCSKHIPLMKKLDKSIDWGTDDVARKAGDFFAAKYERRPWVSESSISTAPPPGGGELTMPQVPRAPRVPTISGTRPAVRVPGEEPPAERTRSSDVMDAPAPEEVAANAERPVPPAEESEPDVLARIIRALRGGRS